MDKSSPNAGFVLLMFYHLYDGKVLFYVGVVWPPGVPAFESSFFYRLLLSLFQNRTEFESELIERFGSLVKMPLLRPDR